jgi:hypothetical protein
MAVLLLLASVWAKNVGIGSEEISRARRVVACLVSNARAHIEAVATLRSLVIGHEQEKR